MPTLYLILLAIAALCLAAAAANVSSRLNLTALGLLAFVLVPLIQRVDNLS